MAQVTDYVIANGSGSAVRADINNVFAAANSANSGTTAPSNAVAGTLWLDTSVSPATLKRRNAANTAWIEVNPDTVPATSLRGNSTESAAVETNVTMPQLKTMLGYAQSLSTSGYQQLPSGLIIQWGSDVITTNAGGGGTVTYPVAFPTAAFIVSFSVGDNNLSNDAIIVGVESQKGLSNAGFQSSKASSSLRVNFIAFGE